MVSSGIVIGGLFVIALFIFGAVQTHLPRTSLAGAVTGPSQQQINLCMNDCMRACVTIEGSEPACLESCNKKCGA